MGKSLKQRLYCLTAFTLLLFPAAINARPYLKIQQVRSLSPQELLLEVSVAKISPIANLKQESFSLLEGGQPIAAFQMPALKNHHDPKHLVLLIDSSRSLKPRKFDYQKSAALQFLKNLHENDKMAVYSFNDRTVLEIDFTSDKRSIENAIRGIKRNGRKTALYDAILAGFKLTSALKNARKSVIVYTDGKDNGSSVLLADLLHRAETENTPVFIAGTGNSVRLKALARLARVSGGEAFRATKTENIKNVFQLLTELLDSTYFLSYKTSAQPGTRVEIEVKMKHRDGQGFFADSDTYSYELPALSIAPAQRPESTNEPAIKRNAWFQGTGDTERILMFLGGLLVLLLIFIIILLLVRKTVVKVEVPANIVMPAATIMSAADEKAAAVSGKYSDHKIHDEKAKLPLDYFHAYLTEKEGPHTGRKYRINWHVVTIGSAAENSIVINDSTVSLRHVQIEREKGQFVLYDLVSENGTFLNGKKLLRPRELNDFDEIQVGRTKLIFRKASA